VFVVVGPKLALEARFLLIYLVYELFKRCELSRVGTVRLFYQVEEFLGSLDIGFIEHHSTLSNDFALVWLRVVKIVVCHLQLNLTVCSDVVHLLCLHE
jgi:hypothetical protein